MGLQGKEQITGGNYFVKQMAILEAKFRYRQPLQENGEKIYDVILELKLKGGKKDGGFYETNFSVFGNYKWDELTNTVKDWGSAFKVRHLINKTNIKDFGTDDIGVIDSFVADALLGRTFYLLSYRYIKDNGEVGYRNFDIVGSNEEEVKKAFLKAVDSEYKPYKYTPAEGTEDASFNYGDNVATAENTSYTSSNEGMPI